jgi:hypothetical protein
MFTQDGNNIVIAIRVPSEDIFDDHDCLLKYVRDFAVNQLEENFNARIGSAGDLDSETTNGANSFANKVDIYFRRVSI